MNEEVRSATLKVINEKMAKLTEKKLDNRNKLDSLKSYNQSPKNEISKLDFGNYESKTVERNKKYDSPDYQTLMTNLKSLSNLKEDKLKEIISESISKIKSSHNKDEKNTKDVTQSKTNVPIVPTRPRHNSNTRTDESLTNSLDILEKIKSRDKQSHLKDNNSRLDLLNSVKRRDNIHTKQEILKDENAKHQVENIFKLNISDHSDIIDNKQIRSTKTSSVTPTPKETKVQDQEKPKVTPTPKETKVPDQEKPKVAPTPKETKVQDQEKTKVTPVPKETKVQDQEKTKVTPVPKETKVQVQEKPKVTPVPKETKVPEQEKTKVTPVPKETKVQEIKTGNNNNKSLEIDKDLGNDTTNESFDIEFWNKISKESKDIPLSHKNIKMIFMNVPRSFNRIDRFYKNLKEEADNSEVKIISFLDLLFELVRKKIKLSRYELNNIMKKGRYSSMSYRVDDNKTIRQLMRNEYDLIVKEDKTHIINEYVINEIKKSLLFEPQLRDFLIIDTYSSDFVSSVQNYFINSISYLYQFKSFKDREMKFSVDTSLFEKDNIIDVPDIINTNIDYKNIVKSIYRRFNFNIKIPEKKTDFDFKVEKLDSYPF